jgi:hypothetical protein
MILISAAAFIVMSSIVVGLSLTPLLMDQTFATQGCCKARGCSSCSWYVVPKTYEECQKLNEDRDGDDVKSKRGIICWDLSC